MTERTVLPKYLFTLIRNPYKILRVPCSFGHVPIACSHSARYVRVSFPGRMYVYVVLMSGALCVPPTSRKLNLSKQSKQKYKPRQ